MCGEKRREIHYSRFRRTVCRHLRERLIGSHRAEIENGAALFKHFLAEDLTRKNGADKIEFIDELKTLRSKAEERVFQLDILCHLLRRRSTLGVVASGTVNKNIDTLEFLKNNLLRRFKAVSIKNIRLDRNAILKPFFYQLIAELLGDIASEI